MKEFEKWHSNYGCDLSVDCGDIDCYTTCKEIRAEAWRAALECVQDMACKGGILQNDFVIREWIREELQSDVLPLEERQSE